MEAIVNLNNQLGECVLWCERSSRVLWTDILGSTLYAHQLDSGQTSRWAMPERLASFALTDDDDCLLLGLASRLAFFRFASGALETIAEVEPELRTRLNDGRCDRAGNFVFGTLHEEEPKAAVCSFYRLNAADLRLERLALGHVKIANSICFSPDGRTMYYADSSTREIRCCDYNTNVSDRATCAVANLREFAPAHAAPGDPDGSTIDADGYLWSTRWGAGQVVRFAPDGGIDRVLSLPAPQPTCPAFGGAALDTLYVTTAAVGLRAGQIADAPKSGGVFGQRLPVRGLPEARFAGRRC